MKPSEAKLTAKQEAAVAALLTHPTIDGAAKACSVSDVTLHRWLLQPVFADAYAVARRQAVEAAIGLLQKACGGAVAVLVQIMADTTKPGSVRISAARSVLDYAFKGAELLDLEVRLQTLEVAAQVMDGKSHA